jgi:hypothetical protein
VNFVYILLRISLQLLEKRNDTLHFIKGVIDDGLLITLRSGIFMT